MEKNFEIGFISKKGVSRHTFIDAKDELEARVTFKEGLNGDCRITYVTEVPENQTMASN